MGFAGAMMRKHRGEPKYEIFHGKQKQSDAWDIAGARKYLKWMVSKGYTNVIVKDKKGKTFMTDKDLRESKLRTWLEEEVAVSAEKRNWRQIEPKMDSAIMQLDGVEKLVGSKFRGPVRKIVNSLKAIRADIRLAD